MKKFSTDYQPKRRSNNFSLLKEYVADNSLSMYDQIKIFKNVLCTKTQAELQHIVRTGKEMDGEPVSALVWGFCLAWMADCKKGMKQSGIFSQLMDREHGKPNQPITIEGEVNITQMTPEERDQRIEYLMQKVREESEDE